MAIFNSYPSIWVNASMGPGAQQPFHRLSQVTRLGREALDQAEDCHWAAG